MDREEILNAIRELGKSQGFYGRLYCTLMECKENDYNTYNEIMSALVRKRFKDSLDLILFLEC